MGILSILILGLVVLSLVALRNATLFLRKGALPIARRWQIRAVWCVAWTLLGLIAEVLQVYHVLDNTSALFAFSLVAFALWAGIGRFIVWVLEERPRWFVISGILFAVFWVGALWQIFLVFGSEIFHRVPPLLNYGFGALGFFVGFRPAIKRWQFNRALTRAKGEK